MTTRNHFIDSLRGIAILVMMLTHVTAYYPSDKMVAAIWDWSHFSVPIFIFCSAYLFFQKNLHKPFSGLSYLKKRVLRLLMPYYIFLLFFIPTLFLLKPEAVTMNYILKSIFLTGGVDINWLVLLFLFFALLLPLFIFLAQKQKILLWIGFILSVSSAVLFLWNMPLPYKYIMWLPWSVLLYFTFFYLTQEKKQTKLLLLFLTTTLIFLMAYFMRIVSDQSVVLIHNKYPPNILYLGYGMSVLLLLSFLFKHVRLPESVTKTLHYFSLYSYQLYFIHYIILIIIAAFLPQLKLSWISFFLILVPTTVITQQLMAYTKKVLFKEELKKSHLLDIVDR